MSDLRGTLLDAYANAAVVVSGVATESLGDPTPCAGYDVAALIDHLVEAGRRAAALGWGEAPPPGDASPHVELTEAPAQLRRTAEEATAAWSDDGRLAARVTMPWGETYAVATLVDMYVVELATHAWDLAQATGQLGRLDPALAAPALEGARAMIRPEWRNLVTPGSPYGTELPAPSDADDWERLAAFMGRDTQATLTESRRPV